MRNLRTAAATGAGAPRSTESQFGYRALSDVAGLAHGASSPQGIATTAAAIAAPEVVGPILMAHGFYSGVKGWGDLSNPDTLQGELNAGAEIAGGGAMTAGAIRAGGGPAMQSIKANVAAKSKAAAPIAAASDFEKAVPPSKSAPYAPADYKAARPYLEAEHSAEAINGVEHVRDAADSAIGKIEDKIDGYIKSLPKDQPISINSNPIQDARQALSSNVRKSFVADGLKALEDYPLDQQPNLAEADAIRRQLNADNKAVLKQNSYDVATARATDPGFAAREAAAESLRNGIYDKLDERGITGVRALRLDEGSLIKIRNAAQNQIFNGEKVVQSSAPNGPVRQVGAALTKAGATGLGAYVAGPPGAIVGAGAGEVAARTFTPEALTKNALIERSFSKSVTSGAPVPAISQQPTQALSPIATTKTAIANKLPLSSLLWARPHYADQEGNP